MNDKPSRGRPSRDSIGERLANILAVASEEFIDKGFERSTIEAIARKAGAAKRTIYQHFASKENLLVEVFRAFSDEFSVKIAAFIDDDRPLEDVLTDIGNHTSEHFFDARQQRCLRLMIAEAEKVPALTDILALSAAACRAPIVDYFSRLCARGELVIDDIELATIQFNNLCSLGFHFLVFSSEPLSDPQSRRRIVHSAVELFLARYRPRKA